MGLNLPLQQAAIDRMGTPVEAFLKRLAEVETVVDGQVVSTWIMGNPEGDYGPDPMDPPVMRRLDNRGWDCQPGSGCVWVGLV
ncbi:hypothetical protein ACWHLZ_29075 [Streptomyces chartreusis]